MANSSSAERHQPRRESTSSPSLSIPRDIQPPDVSDLLLDCEQQKKGDEKGSGGEVQSQDADFHWASATQVDEGKEMVITSIRATDIALGLRRIPAAFYIIVKHGGLAWRTDNKRVSVNNDVVEWDGLIPVPSDPSATISFGISASFELQPTLGKGEQLRNLTVTMKQLLDCSSKHLPFTFLPGHSDVVSPCSSLSVTVSKCGRSQGSKFLVRRFFDSHYSPTDWHDQLEHATDQGHMAFSCFRKHSEKRDLEQSIEDFERALNICPADHPCRAATESNIAMAKFIHFQADDTELSLAVPITLYHDALSTRPAGHPDRPSTLIHLAAVQFALFEKQQQKTNLDYAEVLLNEAKNLSSAESHENVAANFMLRLLAGCKAGAVQANGQSSNGSDSTSSSVYRDPVTSLRRYEQFGILDDLQQAISDFKAFISWSPNSGIQHLPVIEYLTLALKHRYDRFGELSDLEEMISRTRALVDITPDDHPRKPDFLSNLGTCFVDRFHRVGELDDLDQGIFRYRDAIDLVPDNYPRKPVHLYNLATAFRARFEHLGELDDLQQAISMATDAVDLTPDSHPQKHHYLECLSGSFVARFNRLGEVSDLERAISRLKEAVNLTADGHPDKPSILKHLAESLRVRFQRLGQLEDLEQTIANFGNAVDLSPGGDPGKPDLLQSLAESFGLRYERLGQLRDLEETIAKYSDAVDLIPGGDPHKLDLLQRLAESFKVRYERLRQLGDLEQMIAKFRDAVDLTPYDHALKADCLSNLACSFFTRFQRLGQLGDIEQAISRSRAVVDLTPDGHPRLPEVLGYLATFLKARYERLGELGDLEEAISTFGRGADLTPSDNSRKSCALDSIGKSFLVRFQRLGELGDLERAISILIDAVRITPDDHFHKPSHLSGLAISFIARFKRIGELGDLEQAILKFREAAILSPDGHPNKPGYLSNLGQSLKLRFDRLGEVGDLEQSISRTRGAIDLIPDGHPEKPGYLLNIGHSLIARHYLGHPDDSEEAISSYSCATRASIGSPATRLRASMCWITCARRFKHHSLFEACSTAVTLLHDVAWIGVPLTVRCHELLQGADVAREAAGGALDLGHVQTAVEWLEQGRSVLWGELFQLRSSYEELESVHPNHAHRLQQISTALENAVVTREKSLSLLSDHLDPHNADHPMESLEQQAKKHRALAIERDELLQEIHGLPGFERFLLHKEFSKLRASAHSGPVVILNVARSRCDALIVLADVEDVIQVPLPNFTVERSAGLQMSLKSMVRAREGQRVQLDYAIRWKGILSTLWKCVAKPVLDALKISTHGNPSRIFWCPTGPFTFLPIHAAGLYDEQHLEPGHKLSDFVVSSYVPTLSILTPSPDPESVPGGDLRFLAVPQPLSDGMSPLPGVNEEMGCIEEAVQNSSSAPITLLRSSVGTVEEVLGMMKEVDWVHFACHGTQDDEKPTDSGLCLADGRRLKLSDIIGLSRPRGGLAFLSACETAMGDKGLSDEAVHIAAGMLFAGYGSVIATMWSISDRIAPGVAKDVYEQLFRHNGRPDPRETARALQDAVGRIRDGGASFEEWIPFIHIGL